MNKKEVSKANSNKRMKTTKRADKQRGAGMFELLMSASTLAATIVAVWPWTSSPKLPPIQGD